jgi:hypothetical protein
MLPARNVLGILSQLSPGVSLEQILPHQVSVEKVTSRIRRAFALEKEMEALDDEEEKSGQLVHVSEPASPYVGNSMPTAVELASMIEGWRRSKDGQSISNHKGDGPHTFSSDTLQQWLATVAASDVSVRAERQKLHREGLACEQKGGDFEMSNVDYIRIFAWLKQARNPVSEVSLYSFNNAVISVSDAVDQLIINRAILVQPHD